MWFNYHFLQLGYSLLSSETIETDAEGERADLDISNIIIELYLVPDLRALNTVKWEMFGGLKVR